MIDFDDNPLAFAAYSGGGTLPTSGRRMGILRAHCNGQNGLASVHVNVQDSGPAVVVEGSSNQKVELTIRWKTGTGGGETQIDASHGGWFTVGGAEYVEILGQLVSGNYDVALNAHQAKRVDASVHWGASINPKEALWSAPAVLPDATGSIVTAIPSQAASMMAVSSSLSEMANVVALMTRTNGATPAAAEQIARFQNPFTTSCPIVNGSDYVRFILAGATVRVTPVFILSL